MKDIIEIPFGAHDSELKGFEYTIPEGYEAEIKDGKVIVRKNESKDEKIRKALLRCCDDWEKGQFGCMAKEDVPAIRAWLEKQKESLHVSETCKENIDSFTDEDELIRKEILECIETLIKQPGASPRLCDWIAYLEKQKELPTNEEMLRTLRAEYEKGVADTIAKYEQKEQNDEDKEDSDFIIYHPLKNGKGEYECIPYSFYGSLTSFSEDKDLIDFLRTCFYTEEECNEWIEKQKEQRDYRKLYEDIAKSEWFKKAYVGKSLGEEFEQKEQKPSEWSEEEKGILLECISVLQNSSHWLLADKLSSLRPQPHWKPSEEQMDALETAVSSLQSSALESLYNKLNKL